MGSGKQVHAPAGERCRVVVGESNATERDALARLLRHRGVEPVECPDPRDLIEVAKRAGPDAVLVNVDQPNLDLNGTVRVLRRCAATACAAVVLTCAADTDAFRLSALRATGAFAVLVRPLTCATVSDALARAAAHARAERKRRAPAARSQSPTSPVPGSNALLVREVRCRFHAEPNAVARYMLRSGRIVTDTNFFDLPVYRSAPKGVDFVDFHALGVTVCPHCLFASNDPGLFVDPGDRSRPKPVELNPATAVAIAETARVRQLIAGRLPASFFTEKRTLAQALVANRLAIQCSELLFEHNRYALPLEVLRIANGHLRLAMLLAGTGQPEAAVEPHYRAAYEWLRKAFPILEGPALYKAMYQLIACAIHLGDDRSANTYVDRLNAIARGTPVARADASALDRYVNQSRKAWADRDDHRGPSALARALAAA